jgi:hypothetical protein
VPNAQAALDERAPKSGSNQVVWKGIKNERERKDGERACLSFRTSEPVERPRGSVRRRGRWTYNSGAILCQDEFEPHLDEPFFYHKELWLRESQLQNRRFI